MSNHYTYEELQKFIHDMKNLEIKDFLKLRSVVYIDNIEITDFAFEDFYLTGSKLTAVFNYDVIDDFTGEEFYCVKGYITLDHDEYTWAD